MIDYIDYIDYWLDTNEFPTFINMFLTAAFYIFYLVTFFDPKLSTVNYYTNIYIIVGTISSILILFISQKKYKKFNKSEFKKLFVCCLFPIYLLFPIISSIIFIIITKSTAVISGIFDKIYNKLS